MKTQMRQTDEQQAAREEKRRKTTETWFRRRWPLTAIWVLMLALELRPVMTTGTLWHSTFPYFDLSRFIGHRGSTLLLLSALGFTMMLVGLWLEVARYRHDQQRQAQEALMADMGRQTEGVWPPAPQKTE